jgi:hypothetical protein
MLTLEEAQKLIDKLQADNLKLNDENKQNKDKLVELEKSTKEKDDLIGQLRDTNHNFYIRLQQQPEDKKDKDTEDKDNEDEVTTDDFLKKYYKIGEE